MQKHSLFFSLMAFACTAGISVFAALPADAVKASQFGYDKADATKCLQAAINSGAKKVIVDNVGSPWIVEPINMVSDQEVVLQDGVVILAKENCFKGLGDSLITFKRVKNAVLRGEGKALLKMRKKDYQDTKRYEWAEWRMCLEINGSENIHIHDLTVESSGGDGVYVSGSGGGFPVSRNVTLENLICNDHHRQGISVISAENLLVKHCQFNTTSGTPPQCGIDIEPNRPSDRVVNAVFEDCIFNENASAGIDLYLSPLDATTVPVSIVFRRCVSHNNRSRGITITSSHSTPVKGTVRFEECDVDGNKGGALFIGAQQPNGLDITFQNCTFQNRPCTETAFVFTNGSVRADFTGVHFVNCKLDANKATPAEYYPNNGCGLVGLDGDVTLADGSKIDFPKLIADNKPNPDLREFATEVLDLHGVAPYTTDAKPIRPNSLNTRGNFAFAVYFPAAGDYPIQFIPTQVGKAVPKTNVAVKDMAGNSSDQFKMGLEPYTYVIHAKNKGMLQFEVTKCHCMQIKADIPWGYIVNTRLSMIWGGHHDFYFVVPAGLQEVAVEVQGEFGEHLDAALLNGEGKIVAQQKTIRSAVILSAKRAANAPEEVWILKLDNIVEDHAIRLGKNLLPLASIDPKFLLHRAK